MRTSSEKQQNSITRSNLGKLWKKKPQNPKPYKWLASAQPWAISKLDWTANRFTFRFRVGVPIHNGTARKHINSPTPASERSPIYFRNRGKKYRPEIRRPGRENPKMVSSLRIRGSNHRIETRATAGQPSFHDTSPPGREGQFALASARKPYTGAWGTRRGYSKPDTYPTLAAFEARPEAQLFVVLSNL